jgi:hypothetical protein
MQTPKVQVFGITNVATDIFQKSIHRKVVLNKSGKLIIKMTVQHLRELTATVWNIKTRVAVAVPHISCCKTTVFK